jgi:hypothetical protein
MLKNIQKQEYPLLSLFYLRGIEGKTLCNLGQSSFSIGSDTKPVKFHLQINMTPSQTF